jgi:hypothetical protein
MRLHRFTLLGLVAFAFGCSGGQTGDLSGKNDKDGDHTGENGVLGGCDEVKDELGSFDERTPSGSAEQLLAFAEQSFDAPLTWRAPKEGASWSLSPEAGESSIHIEVTRGEKAYELSYEQPANEQGQLSNAICPAPGLGVDAHVKVTTAGGALLEEYDTLLRSQGPHFASFSVPIDLSKLGGALTAASSNPNAKLVQLTLAATLSAAGTTGSLSGIEQVELGEVASAGLALLAVWPDVLACASTDLMQDGVGVAVAADADALGITGDAAAELLSSMTPVDIDWEQGGSRTKLTVTASLSGEGCMRPATGPFPEHTWGSVTYPALYAVESADGRVKSEYAGTLQSFPNLDGNANDVSAEARVVFAPNQVAATGFSGIEVPAGVEALVVELQERHSSALATGSLFLNGVSSPPCPMADPEPQPGMGASSPGCAGQMRHVLEAGTWGP